MTTLEVELVWVDGGRSGGGRVLGAESPVGTGEVVEGAGEGFERSEPSHQASRVARVSRSSRVAERAGERFFTVTC